MSTALIETDPPALPALPPLERAKPDAGAPRDRRDPGRGRRERSRREPGEPSGKLRDEGKGKHVDIHA